MFLTKVLVESRYKIEYVYKYTSDLGTTDKFSEEFGQ